MNSDFEGCSKNKRLNLSEQKYRYLLYSFCQVATNNKSRTEEQLANKYIYSCY